MININRIIILFIMIFLHIVDDYYLQGCLAQLKQKSWWSTNAVDAMYKNDYKIALIVHGFSWAFMTHIPLLLQGQYWQDEGYLIFVIIAIVFNAIIHAFVDNLKANKKIINLVQDQTYHFIQLFFTWSVSNLIL